MASPKALLTTMILMIAFFAFSCKDDKEQPAHRGSARRDAPIQVEGFIVKTKPLSEKIEVPGTIQAFESTDIRSEISGRIVQLNIPEGRRVAKGALLVKLFDGDLQAQLKKLEVQLSIAEKTAERQNELLKINGISQQEYDLSALQVNNLKADIQLVKVDISKTEIRAPFTGQIGLRNVSMGAYVTPENIITTISEVNKLKLEFTVPEKYSESMTKGRTVNFYADNVNKRFSSEVLATESTVELNTRTLRVRAVVKGNDPALVPGGFVKVLLQMGKNDEAMIIPTQAVIPQARSKQVIIYRNGKPEFETVKTGIRDSSFVQILDGIKVGDTVVMTGLLAIRPESKIALTKVN